MKRLFITIFTTIFLAPTIASAAMIGGVDFPLGSISFADSVTSYDPIYSGGDPTAPHTDPSNALGTPDYDGVNSCPLGSCSFVSLGDGGSITLEFTDNLLTGGGDSGDDLWIFEVGPDVEDTFVEISWDNTSWYAVGSVGGSTAGVDIDFFGFGTTDKFRYVRLTDNGDLDGQSGRTVGADIDAVGAISSAPVPIPAAAWLFVSGLLGLIGFSSHKKAT